MKATQFKTFFDAHWTQVRWAVLNVAALLRRYTGLHDKLAEAMDQGKSVATCIGLIEEQLKLEGAGTEDKG